MSSELADSPAGRILWNATTLFYQEGIRGIGVDRLIREADVAKATFYAHYASKHDLVVAYLKTWDQGWFGWLTEHTAKQGHDPELHLLSVFDFLARLARDLALIMDGAMVTAALERTARAAGDARRVAVTVLDSYRSGADDH